MTVPHVVRLDDVSPQRWRNGGGWTRELLAQPAGDGWRVRVSVADIETDGPFSSFPGVHRHFAVLAGAGVELTIDGVAHRVALNGGAVSFTGDAVTACRLLDGPTRDLNLMVRGSTGRMRPVLPGQPWSPAVPSCGLFATDAGRCRAGDRVIPMPPCSLAWFDAAPASLLFDATGWWLAP
jgi:uncharacterized protein